MSAPALPFASAYIIPTAVFLVRETKGLLIGEPARESVRRSLLKIAEQQVGVERALNLVSVHMAPDQIVVAIDLDFSNALSVRQIEQTVRSIERRIKDRHPEVIAVFVKPRDADAADR